MSDLKDYFDKMNIREVPRNEAQGLHDFIEKTAKRLNINEPIRLLDSDSPIANLGALSDKTKKGTRITGVLITKGAKQLLNEQEMKAAIGHELSHVKDWQHITQYIKADNVLKLPIYGLPLAFAGGYYILDKAYRKQQNNPETKLSFLDAVQNVVNDELQAAKHFIVDEKLGFTPDKKTQETKSLTEVKALWYENTVRAGGTVAAAAAGYITGLALLRHQSMSAEFRADRIGALVTGNPEAMISGVQKVMKQMQVQAGKQMFSSGVTFTSPDVETAIKRLWQRTKRYFQTEKLLFQELECKMAHPILKQRADALRKIPSETFQEFLEKSNAMPSQPSL